MDVKEKFPFPHKAVVAHGHIACAVSLTMVLFCNSLIE